MSLTPPFTFQASLGCRLGRSRAASQAVRVVVPSIAGGGEPLPRRPVAVRRVFGRVRHDGWPAEKKSVPTPMVRLSLPPVSGPCGCWPAAAPGPCLRTSWALAHSRIPVAPGNYNHPSGGQDLRRETAHPAHPSMCTALQGPARQPSSALWTSPPSWTEATGFSWREFPA